ncbi:MAG: hypothetical protein NVS3B5_16380 [Sphingomicrobium sp.]
MQYSQRLAPPLVAAAIAMVVLANFSIVRFLAVGQTTSFELFHTIWPVLLFSTVAVILVMSLLYSALQDIIREMAKRERDAVEFSLHDPLTGLGNRVLLHDRITSAVERYARSGEGFAVLMLDLDNFKTVNDVLGHHMGDQLLKCVAQRLKALMRETDTVARLGGDEFVIIQTSVGSASVVPRMCARIIKELSEPFQIEGHEVIVGVSIGSALCGNEGVTATEYLRRSDIALHKAKNKGRDCACTFSATMDAEVQRRAIIQADLREALRKGKGLEVHYQPQVDAKGAIQGVEALLRWTHPVFGILSPTEVVPIAEESGLIDKLGDFVFREACQIARRWPNLSVAVNVSPKQFSKSARLSERFRSIAVEFGVPCSQIELEITESVFLQGVDCERHIKMLRSQGFRVALDDFGTGYSSLSYLRRFKVDRIKLDKSFAEDQNVHSSIAILRAAVLLAHTLGLEVIAEGIETAEQEQVALQAGCDGLQGYRYGSAMPSDGLPGYSVPVGQAAA